MKHISAYEYYNYYEYFTCIFSFYYSVEVDFSCAFSLFKMSRDDKQLEMASGIMLQRTNEMKASLQNLIMKVELDHQNMQFPDVLDSFAVISGQVIPESKHN
jgi:hypothetical protein